MNAKPRGWKWLLFLTAVVCALRWPGSIVQANWFHADWPTRRAIEVTWDDTRNSGEDLAWAEIYTAGGHLPNGSDIRIATEEGKLVASEILQNGPGDRVRVVFSLVKGVRRYYAYFGNPKPPAVDEKKSKVNFHSGMLMESKLFAGGQVDNFRQIARTWEQSGDLIGRTMIDRPFLGINPFGPQEATISKLTASLFIPQDGSYAFAMANDDRGGLLIDDEPVLFAFLGPADIRHNKKIDLKRGRHDFVYYHVNFAGPGWFSVCWKRPDMSNFDVIPRDSFGVCFKGVAGALEIKDKVLVADFSVEYMGECFIVDHLTHRYRFSVNASKTATPPKYDWDFGDGQTATGLQVDHVYLSEGVFPVRITARVGANSDAQTTQLPVTRAWERLASPPNDEPGVQAEVIASYDVKAMPIGALAQAVWLHLKANKPTELLPVAERLASLSKHTNVNDSMSALKEATRVALEAGQVDTAVQIWAKVPTDSDLQPGAAREYARVLLWWSADFAKAIEILTPLSDRKDPGLRRSYGQALILTGKGEEGRKVLLELPSEEAPERQVAISGALARTIEFFITEKDPESGEESWEKWQQRYPSDFLEGYSALLRVKLIELRNRPKVAAKVAEAFAMGMPKSSYAPSLLDRASKLLEKIDLAKSKALHETLKQKYPEDPLAN